MSQKIPSFHPQKTPENRAFSGMVSIRSATDYSPFGVQLENRNFLKSGLAEDYRMGFQGMECDNEVGGDGNSYTTEFRQYDSRSGRWNSIDPLFKIQPGQSTYKAFLNNPLVFSDVEGKTEFLTVIIKSELTGDYVKMSVPISDQIMTDGRKYTIWTSQATSHLENAYYDFSRVHIYTIKEDGSMLHSGYTEILKDRGVKDWDYVWFDGANWGDKQDEPSPFEMKGGLYMTGSKGQGTKYYSKNADDIGNVDHLIQALSGLNDGKIKDYSGVISTESILYSLKWVQDFNSKFDPLIDEFIDLIKISGETSDILALNSKGEVPSVCKPSENGGCSHDKATYEEAEKGDTLGGKNKCVNGNDNLKATPPRFN